MPRTQDSSLDNKLAIVPHYRDLPRRVAFMNFENTRLIGSNLRVPLLQYLTVLVP